MIYLDNSATTRPDPGVLESYMKVAAEHFGNASSLHGLGVKSARLLSQAREQAASLLRVKTNEIIFTSGGSEGNNLAIKGFALANRKHGRHIITTSIEHPSVHEACRQLGEDGFDITYLPVSRDGFVSPEAVKEAIRPDTILVSIIHVNNETGAIQPVEQIGTLLKNYPHIGFHVDHVQGAGKVPLDIDASGIDFCTFSGHKFHALKGTGILYVKTGAKISPIIAGGAQELQLRSGTENVPGIVAMAKALRLAVENLNRNAASMAAMKQKLYDGLQRIDGITIHTPGENAAPHILNFSIDGLKPEVFVHMLEEQDIYVSTTSACSSRKKAPSKTLLAMGIRDSLANSSIRISLSHENNINDVPKILAAISSSLEKLKSLTR